MFSSQILPILRLGFWDWSMAWLGLGTGQGWDCVLQAAGALLAPGSFNKSNNIILVLPAGPSSQA